MRAGKNIVSLLIPTEFGYARGLLRGIYEYAHSRSDWQFAQPQMDYTNPNHGTMQSVDGIIALIDRPAMADRLSQVTTPLVNVGGPQYPADAAVIPDDQAIGELAASYLLGLGFKRFGVIDRRNKLHDESRRDAFVSAVQETDASCSTFIWQQEEAIDWVEGLGKPAAIFGVSDSHGALAIEVCHRLKLRVPDDIAVLGVNNDDVNCLRVTPTLSSIQTCPERAGYLAAETLQKLMEGQEAQAQQRVPPAGVVARGSTDTLAVTDPQISAALQYIRENVEKALIVDDVLDVVSMSRSSLERGFKATVGRTPLQEIRRSRIERAKSLLASTGLSMREVAFRSGFHSPQRLASVFAQYVGMTPSQYRKQFRES